MTPCLNGVPFLQAIILGPSSRSEVENPTGRKCCTPPRWGDEFHRWRDGRCAWKEPKFRSKVIYFFHSSKIKDWQSWFINFTCFFYSHELVVIHLVFWGGVWIDSCCGKKPSPGYMVLKVCRVKTVQHHTKQHNPQMLNVLGCPRKLVNG